MWIFSQENTWDLSIHGFCHLKIQGQILFYKKEKNDHLSYAFASSRSIDHSINLLYLLNFMQSFTTLTFFLPDIFFCSVQFFRTSSLVCLLLHGSQYVTDSHLHPRQPFLFASCTFVTFVCFSPNPNLLLHPIELSVQLPCVCVCVCAHMRVCVRACPSLDCISRANFQNYRLTGHHAGVM